MGGVVNIIDELRREFPGFSAEIEQWPGRSIQYVMWPNRQPKPESYDHMCVVTQSGSDGWTAMQPESRAKHGFTTPTEAAEYATGTKRASYTKGRVIDAEVPREPTATQVRPAHYGGTSNPYECIKVIRAWGLNFELGNVAKYLSRAGKKPGVEAVDDLRKLITYAQMEIERRETKP